MKIIAKSIEIAGKKLTLEVGRVAQQADGAVLATYGDTVVLATVVCGKKDTELSYFPLFVEYVEKLYAGGRIKGSRWVKREGRPTDESVLKGRLIDRSIRPLFPKHFKRDVQVILTILSVDKENNPDMVGMIAASVALSISPIPWRGPIAGVRVGYINNEFVINPSTTELIKSQLDLVVSGTGDKVLMLEAGANEINESLFIEAVKRSTVEIEKVIELIVQMQKEVGKKKIEISDKEDKTLVNYLIKHFARKIDELIIVRADNESDDDEALTLLADELIAEFEDKYTKRQALDAIDYLFKQRIREQILNGGKRPDGRGVKDIRPLSASIALLPRTHGSAIFQRGTTQALTITTLASPALEQWIESAEGEETKRYIHHYFMPPYSVGETGRFGFTSRREIGHGALTERALKPVIPPLEKFPYTIRVVSEIMSSNGSTSMASVCGSTLSLMDAGVPIKEPVAGLSFGLIAKGEKYVLLWDIMGLEDFTGDMDFKVAGTKNGITAVQLDVKIDGLTQKMIEETIMAQKDARVIVLKVINDTLAAPRPTISQYAPKIEILKIPVEKIGEVIGPGGKIIRSIISQTGCEVNVEDDGTLTVSGTDPKKVEEALTWIKTIIRDVQAGEEFEGTVKRLMPFGAFVELIPGKEGLVHVSQMSRDFVKDPSTIVAIGQKVKVRVVEIDMQGRINLSMMFGEDAKEKPFAAGRRDDRGGGDRRRRHDRRSSSYAHPHLKSYNS